MVKTTAIALAVAAAVTGASSTARSDTLVFPVEGGDSTANTRLTRALLAGADSEKPRLADTPLGEAASLLECSPADRACLDSMAQAMEAGALLAASLRAAGGEKTTAHVTLHRRGQSPLVRDVELPSDPEAAAPILEKQVRAMFRGESAAAEPVPPPVAASTSQPAGHHDAALTATTKDGEGTPSRFSLGRVRPWSWAVAGGGLVLVGVGAAFSFKAGGLKDDVEAAPRETVADFEHLKDLEDQGETATSVSNALFIGGGIAFLAGATLILWQGMTPTAEERGPALGLSPAPLQGGAGLVLSGELP